MLESLPLLRLQCCLCCLDGGSPCGVLSTWYDYTKNTGRVMHIQWSPELKDIIGETTAVQHKFSIDVDGFSAPIVAEWINKYTTFCLKAKGLGHENALASFKASDGSEAAPFVEALNFALTEIQSQKIVNSVKRDSDPDKCDSAKNRPEHNQQQLHQPQPAAGTIDATRLSEANASNLAAAAASSSQGLTSSVAPTCFMQPTSSLNQNNAILAGFDSTLWSVPPAVTLPKILTPEVFSTLLDDAEACEQLKAFLPEGQQSLADLSSAFKCSQLQSCIQLLNDAIYSDGNLAALLHSMGVHSVEAPPIACVCFNQPRPMTQFIESLAKHYSKDKV